MKLAEWPRRPLSIEPRVHVVVHTARTTNRPAPGHEPTIYNWEEEGSDDDDAA